MRTRASIALLLPLACLLGCSLPYTQPPQTITGNWQIQSGTAITSPPTGLYLVGALQGSESAPTGTFNTVYTSGANPAIISYTSTYDSSTGSLSLIDSAATYIQAELTLPTDLNTLATGTIIYDPPPVCGIPCEINKTTPAVGAEIAPLNGTYTGTLSGTLTTYLPATTTPISGTASVTFTQSTTPNSSGQFPLTATVTFPSSSGMGTTTLPGLVSGITIELSTEPCIIPFANFACNVVGPGSVLFAYTNPTATQITVTSLTDDIETGTNVTLTGTLTLQ
jgi:hypothetical protein